MNIVKLKINGTKLAILGIYAPCSYLKVHEERDKMLTKKELENNKIQESKTKNNVYESIEDDSEENSEEESEESEDEWEEVKRKIYPKNDIKDDSTEQLTE